MNNVSEALGRIHEAIDGKSRRDVRKRARNGAIVHLTSHAEIDPRDVVTIASSIPADCLKADQRLTAILTGSSGAASLGAKLVGVKTADLDYLVTAAEKHVPAASPPPKQSPPAAAPVEAQSPPKQSPPAAAPVEAPTQKQQPAKA